VIYFCPCLAHQPLGDLPSLLFFFLVFDALVLTAGPLPPGLCTLSLSFSCPPFYSRCLRPGIPPESTIPVFPPVDPGVIRVSLTPSFRVFFRLPCLLLLFFAVFQCQLELYTFSQESYVKVLLPRTPANVGTVATSPGPPFPSPQCFPLGFRVPRRSQLFQPPSNRSLYRAIQDFLAWKKPEAAFPMVGTLVAFPSSPTSSFTYKPHFDRLWKSLAPDHASGSLFVFLLSHRGASWTL